MEKPFTINSTEAKQLVKEAKKYNCCILPYQNRRYDSDFLSVKKVIESGKLGNIVEFHLRYDRYRYFIGPKVEKETFKMVQLYVKSMEKAEYSKLLFMIENYARIINGLFNQYTPHDDRHDEKERTDAIYSCFYILKNVAQN